MNKFLTVYACVTFALAVIMTVLAYYQKRSRVCRTLVSIIYVLTLVGILFGMSALEGRYSMNMLTSSVIAALSLALVCLGEYTGNRIAGKNSNEE